MLAKLYGIYIHDVMLEMGRVTNGPASLYCMCSVHCLPTALGATIARDLGLLFRELVVVSQFLPRNNSIGRHAKIELLGLT